MVLWCCGVGVWGCIFIVSSSVTMDGEAPSVCARKRTLAEETIKIHPHTPYTIIIK